MGQRFSVRVLRSTDAELFYDFFSRLSERAKAFFHPHPLDLKFARKATQKIEPHKRLRLVATIEQGHKQRIIGYSFASFPPLSRKRGVVGAAVLDEFQGQGVGYALAESRHELMRRLDAEEVWASTRQSNARSRALQEKLGFREVSKPVTWWFFAWQVRESPYNYGFFGAIKDSLAGILRSYLSSDRIIWAMKKLN